MQRDLAVLCEAGVEHLPVVVPVVRVIERHRDDGAPVALGRRDQTPPCRPRKAGFHADRTVVHAQQTVVIAQRVPADRAAFCRDDLPEHRVLEGRRGDLGQLMCGGVVRVGRQAVRIVEMRVRQTEFRRFGVHFAHKGGHAAALSRDGDRRIVAGREHESVQRIPQREPFARLQVHRRALDRRVPRLYGIHAVKVTLAERDERGHDLGGGRHRQAAVRVLLEQRFARVRIDHDRPLCAHRACPRQNEQKREHAKQLFHIAPLPA